MTHLLTAFESFATPLFEAPVSWFATAYGASLSIPAPALASASGAVQSLQILPNGWPALNAMMVFGLLLAFGVLGGLLAARVKWLPSITGFMALGLLFGPSGLGILSMSALAESRFLVDIALGLILFRLGTTLHPVKVARDRQLVTTSLSESLATFLLIFVLMSFIGGNLLVAALMAAIAVSSSPAVLIHVAEELHADGPNLRSAKSLVAANNLLSFVLFSLVLPMALVNQQFSWQTSTLLPLYQMIGAIALSIAVAWLVTSIAKLTRSDESHFRFALVVGAVMLTLGLAEAIKVSGLFAGLTLGVACRWLQGRSRLTRVEFGGGGDVFFVILFVFAGANLHLSEIVEYAPLALALVLARMTAKVCAVYVASRFFGVDWRSSLAQGVLLVPMAGLAIGLVQTTNHLIPGMGASVAAVVFAAVAIFETIGPPLTAWALRFAGEAGQAHSAPEKPSNDNTTSTDG